MLGKLLNTIVWLWRLQRSTRSVTLADEARRREILDNQAITSREVLEWQAKLARDTVVVEFPRPRRRPF